MKKETLISYVTFDGSVEELLKMGWERLLQEPKPTVVFCINSTKWHQEQFSSAPIINPEPEPNIFMMVSDGSVHKMTNEEHHKKIWEIDKLEWYKTKLTKKNENWDFKYDYEIQNLKEILDIIKVEKTPYWFGTVAYSTDNETILTTTRGKRGSGFCEIERVDHRNRKIYATEKATLNAPFLEMLLYEFQLYEGRLILHGHKQLENVETIPYFFDGTTQCYKVIDYIREKKLREFNIENHGYYKIFSSFDEAKKWLKDG